jgi:hypothetical protein
MNPSRPRLDPADPFFPSKLRSFEKDAGQRADIESASGMFGGGPGAWINAPETPAILIRVTTARDTAGHYSGVPVSHRVATTTGTTSGGPFVRQRDTYPDDPSGTLGPSPIHTVFPLVELSGRPDVPVGEVVHAWPSQSAQAMEFAYQKPAYILVTGNSSNNWYPGTAQTPSVSVAPGPPAPPASAAWANVVGGYVQPSSNITSSPMTPGARYLALPTDPRADGSPQWLAYVPQTKCLTAVTTVYCSTGTLTVATTQIRVPDVPACF